MAATTVASSLPGAGLMFEFLNCLGSQQDSSWGDTLRPPLSALPSLDNAEGSRTLGGEGTLILSQEAGGGRGVPGALQRATPLALSGRETRQVRHTGIRQMEST